MPPFLAARPYKSEGRAFPVETRYLGRNPGVRLDDAMADAVLKALRAEPGSVLAFLPGQGEIRRVEERLRDRISDANVLVAPLYGGLESAVRRTRPSSRRPQASARSCWRRRSRRRLSPSRGCASSSIAALLVCRGSSRASGSRGWKPCASRAPRLTSAGTRGAHVARRVLPAVGRSGDSQPASVCRSRRSALLISRLCFSTVPNGA